MIRLGLAVVVGLALAVGTRVPEVSGGAVLLLILGGLGLFALRRPGRVAEGHFHGGGDRVRHHEGAHLSAAHRIGARVARAQVGHNPMVRLADPERLTSRDYMAFMLAGEKATGAHGSSHDRAMVRAEKQRMRSRGVTPDEIRRTVQAAEGDARRYARDAGRWAKQL